MPSAISFQGLSTGLQTDALVSAILAQEGRNVQALQARQTRNKQRSSALTSMKTAMNALTVSLAALKDKFSAQNVASTDSNGTYVTATATGAAAGNYDISVTTVATRGRLSSNLVDGNPTNLAVDDPSATIFSGQAKAAFAIRGTDGTIEAFELTNNSLNGLRDAINASGAGVTATIVNTGAATKPYRLVITAKETGTGTTSGVVTLASIADRDGNTATVDPALGILGGSLNLDPGDPEGTGTFDDPKTLTGGLASGAADLAKDAVFTVNGIQITRKTNVVSDVVDGMTFTLKKGEQSGSTTLTVSQDKTAATSAMQDVITKYNSLLKIYKDASATTKGSDGTVIQGALTGDSTARSILSQVRSTLTGVSEGLPESNAYQALSNLGVKTQADGTLTLDTIAFQKAISDDPAAAKRLFTFSGTSSSGSLSVTGGNAKTATGSVGFSVVESSPGVFTGTFTGTSDGSPFSLELVSSNGVFTGAIGTALEGLSVSVTAAATGTLTLSRGAGQAAGDLLSRLTSYGEGTIPSTLTSIESQNRTLAKQVDSGQLALARRKKILEAQFAKLEVTISQLRSSASGLTGLQ